MLYKNTLTSAIFIAAIMLVAWTFLGTLRKPTQNDTIDNTKPDSFMEEVQATVMDKDGKPSLKIVTPKMIHLAINDTSELISPKLTLYRDSPQPWYITSDFAYAAQGVNDVLFKQNVVIQHAADTKTPATVIKTLSLMVHPNQKTAETSDDITMIQPSTVVKATGMHADMNTGSIELLSQARGEYVPNS